MAASFTLSVDYVLENVLEPHHVTRIKILLGQESIHMETGIMYINL